MTIIGLAGNPNTGKSTLFNALTGSNQHVGNWQGKTVEKQAGRLIGHDILLVDLPGTYSLTAYSIEEIIARDFILEEHPDAVVAVVDAANLERNLYLVVQLLEMGTSLILALNMSDIAESRGIQIDVEMLSQKLGGIPVVPTAGCRGTGLDDLKMAITQPLPVCQKPLQVLLPVEMEQEITRLVTYIQQKHDLSDRYIPRWLAIKLLERDENIIDKLAVHPDLIDAAEAAAASIEQALEEEPDIFVAESRYDLIAEWVRAVVIRPDGVQPTFSDKLDKILTHRFWGLPVFFVFMWFVFQITANVSAPYLDWIDGVINQQLIRWAGNLLNVIGLEDTWFGSLMVDGVITGVGGVLVFIPVLVSLYVTLAILEDSGYMARAAFVMDRFMHTLGLQGKSFLPLLVGFGCTVPAVYATRTLENETDRKITGFLTTFMSCG
ncbi:MAG TPA: ferrous iron transport protein B, partial [Aggregatilineales bacterium]|nr:ferrous iron transport protein B [Aggregatilineales bacterium]